MQHNVAIPIGPGFWNIRGSFKFLLGLIDIGTHMSMIQLANGRFLLIDTIPLNPEVRTEIDRMTNNGADIEGIIGVHPFHTLYFKDFYQVYPNVPYYGTPRHLRTFPEIPWRGSLLDCAVRSKWFPEIDMRIPAGAEFVAPQPEKTNHFNCVWVHHPRSRTIHVDDTVMVADNPGFLLSLAGYKHGTMSFHPSMKGSGLLPTPDAPVAFHDWLMEVIRDWDFDNIVAAHTGNKIGGAKQALQELLEKSKPLFDKLIEKKKKGVTDEDKQQIVVQGNECG
eukprot:TRINITY_DN1894_c0_g1_i1.p1 TRINITY_DN1894_c0_g1~~TRINITY_DN1894_c0_g1_i1.p1  ORF type:complete len:279 (-),score=77.50 TRINITY_DN1894_c0_g1_i1:74-910(-)